MRSPDRLSSDALHVQLTATCFSFPFYHLSASKHFFFSSPNFFHVRFAAGTKTGGRWPVSAAHPHNRQPPVSCPSHIGRPPGSADARAAEVGLVFIHPTKQAAIPHHHAISIPVTAKKYPPSFACLSLTAPRIYSRHFCPTPSIHQWVQAVQASPIAEPVWPRRAVAVAWRASAPFTAAAWLLWLPSVITAWTVLRPASACPPWSTITFSWASKTA